MDANRSGNAIVGGKISGKVHSEDRAMLQCARVTCDDAITKTLADGSFVFEHASPGRHKLTVTLQGFKSEVRLINLWQEEHLVQDFTLRRQAGTAKISGHVFDAESKKITSHPGTVVLALPGTN